MTQEQIKIGVLIPCVNEAQNIASLLTDFCQWHQREQAVYSIVVVLSPSQDGTPDIVRKFQSNAPVPLKLIFEKERRGKAHAVNLGLAHLKEANLVILCSGDVRPQQGCLTKLVRACADSRVGLVGGRPVPQGDETKLAVRISHFHWAMHHAIAQRAPKSTEVTVFKNAGIVLDESVEVDEAEIERLIAQQGLEIRYRPDAEIATPAPLALKDYFKRRLSVTRGHLALKASRRFAIGTLSWRMRLQALIEVLEKDRPTLSVLFSGIFIEGLVWVCARVTLFTSGPSAVWAQASSSKHRLP